MRPPYPPELHDVIGNAAFGPLSPINLRLALANHPKLAAAFQTMAHTVLFQSEVAARDREIAVIRTGALARSEYEWGMHVSLYGEQCAFTEAQIQALSLAASWADLSDAQWTPEEKLIVRMVDELHAHSTVSDATWAGLVKRWSHAQAMELLFASAFYRMAACFLNAAAVPLEAASRRFPSPLSQARVPSDEGLAAQRWQ